MSDTPTTLPAPDFKSAANETGICTSITFMGSPSLCVALTYDLGDIDTIARQLKAVMAALDSPSGTILFPPGVRFDITMPKRQELADSGISFRRSDNPDLATAAQILIENLSERVAQNWARYKENDRLSKPC